MHTNCAAFDAAGSTAHYAELKTLITMAPVAAQDFRDSVIERAKAAE